jgi:hypothetical protein
VKLENRSDEIRRQRDEFASDYMKLMDLDEQEADMLTDTRIFARF